MSIVLTIIALILGGVMAGKQMIRNAQLISTYEQVTNYIGLTKLFKEKYLSLPGDMYNATSFWGQNPSCANGTSPGTPNATSTCNGNGDGVISNLAGDVYSGLLSVNYQEQFLYWQHLAMAGFIPGTYVGGEYDYHYAPGSSNPTTPVSGMITINYVQLGYDPENRWYSNLSGHYFTLVSNASYYNVASDPWVITPTEALSLDSKYDDGYPNSGLIQTYAPTWGQTCASNTGQPHYDTTQLDIECVLFILVGSAW